MSMQNILNHYKSAADRAAQNVKWNPGATEEVRKGLLQLAQSTTWVPLIARFEGFFGHPYSEHRSRVPLRREETRKSGGWYKVYKNNRKVGQATIGYGHVLRYRDAGGQMADWWAPYWGKGGDRMTKDEARMLLYHNGRERGYKLLKHFTAVPTQGQYDVILSRSYIGGIRSKPMIRLIKYVNQGKIGAFNNKMRTWNDHLFGEKYEDPNWCEKNRTGTEAIEKCKAQVEYRKRYRKGWRNRTKAEYKHATGKTAPKSIDMPTMAGAPAPTAKPKDLSGERIVLIGDSNAWKLNKDYAAHFKAQGAEVHQFANGGTGCDYWRQVIGKFDELAGKRVSATGKINRGVWRLQTGGKPGWKAGPVGPTQIHVVCLGGNNMNRVYKESVLRYHVDGCIKPLMQLIKKYNGTFAGTVPIGSRRRGKTGEASNVLRARMNAEYAKAAEEVGIPFWNPTTNIAYNTDDLHKKGEDGVHITRTMARQEFESRKSWLGGTGGGYVGTGPMQAYGGTATGEKKGRFDHLKVEVSPEEWLAQYAAYRQRDKSKDKSFEEMRDEYRKHYAKQMKDMLGDDYVDTHARDARYGDAPPSDAKPADPGAPQKPTDQDVPEEACPEGQFVSKYKNFPTQVPDFNFSTFYSELDKYFGSAEDMLKPQGKDCVFGDEHYAAWSKLQQKKQMQSPYVSESKSFLRRLIEEMKKRY